MKNCTDCKYADWHKTAAGRLHPSGDGICRFQWKMPQLPACMYWLGIEPRPCGRRISRREELKEHCAYFARKEGA